MDRKTVFMTKEWKILWPDYYVCHMSRYIYRIETWYFDRRHIILSSYYKNKVLFKSKVH